MAASTASGGGAAAVKNSTTCGSGFFSTAGALSSVAITIGAPHRWVTLWSAMASYIAGARTQRRQTCVPATTDSDHGKHQPLQWNMGSVHRYTGWRGMFAAITLPYPISAAPRWWKTTPFGLPVVPLV